MSTDALPDGARCRLPVTRLCAAGLLALACGCTGAGVVADGENPTFAVTPAEARAALARMRENPVSLERPVVVLGGYLDPGVGPLWTAHRLRANTGDDRFVRVAFLFCGDFDACRAKVIEAVDEAIPSGDPLWTTEVDVVAQSMGGVVARYAAAPAVDDDGTSLRRLRIKRLFTISSPHRGADLASLPIPHPLQKSMRLGSDWIRALNDAYRTSRYELYCYCRLGDRVVGSRNTAPPGETPWWLRKRLLQSSHAAAVADARIEADISRRLRGEEPFTCTPPAPLPAGTERERGAATAGS